MYDFEAGVPHFLLGELAGESITMKGTYSECVRCIYYMCLTNISTFAFLENATFIAVDFLNLHMQKNIIDIIS